MTWCGQDLMMASSAHRNSTSHAPDAHHHLPPLPACLECAGRQQVQSPIEPWRVGRACAQLAQVSVPRGTSAHLLSEDDHVSHSV